MGWWDVTVLGGDTPLDILGELESILGVRELYPVRAWEDETREAVRKAFEKNWINVTSRFADEKCWWSKGWNHEVAIQVVAVVAMASGAEFPEGFKERAIKAANDDEWANEDGSRHQRMVELKKTLEEYTPGNPTEVAEKGLMERIYEVMG